MIDIRKITNGYWWDAQGKYEALINIENKLRELTLQVTDRCNLNCPKCNKTSYTFEDMKTSDILRIIDESCDLGLKHIHFTGGEPTIHPDFLDIVKHCSNKQLRIDMSSNGSFSKEYLYKLINAGIHSINISWDFVVDKPVCLNYLVSGVKWFVNHMVMPSNFKELPVFLIHVNRFYPEIIDIQLMPPRGTAEKFNREEIAYFNEKIVKRCYLTAIDRFPMVAAKLDEILSYPGTDKGVYHQAIKWPCHRSKQELRVGSKGFSTCTYLYRDGYTSCGLNKSVKEAWDICKEECLKAPPSSMCETSCSPEVANFNYFVEEKKA